MHPETRAILFDLDGTLIDTTDLILECFHHSWKTVCGFEHSRESLVKTFGIPLREAMHHLLLATCNSKNDKGNGEPENDVIDQLLALYRAYNLANHDVLARPFEHAGEVLSELRRRGYLIGVVTSKSRELGLRGLRLGSLDGLIDCAVFLEDTKTHKPDPEPILVALRRFNKEPGAAAYVGDSQHDMVAARAAGVLAVAALWGPSPRSDLERERPDIIAESITGLLGVFG